MLIGLQTFCPGWRGAKSIEINKQQWNQQNQQTTMKSTNSNVWIWWVIYVLTSWLSHLHLTNSYVLVFDILLFQADIDYFTTVPVEQCCWNRGTCNPTETFLSIPTLTSFKSCVFLLLRVAPKIVCFLYNNKLVPIKAINWS